MLDKILGIGTFLFQAGILGFAWNIWMGLREEKQQKIAEENRKIEETKREEERRKWVSVSNAIRQLSNCSYKKSEIIPIGVSLCELLQFNWNGAFKEKIKEKVTKFKSEEKIEREDIQEIFDFISQEIENFGEMTYALKMLLKDSKTLVPRPTKDVANYLMGRDSTNINRVTSRKIEIILATCIEEKNLGKKMHLSDFKDIWLAEAKVNPHDEFKDGHAIHNTVLVDTLDKLSGKNRGQRELKSILQIEGSGSGDRAFWIEEKDADFVREVLSFLSEELTKSSFGLLGQSTGKIKNIPNQSN